jgi:sulfate permease, SulP family
MAYASVAGLPVAVGLYTAFIPMAIYALLGTSRVLSVSSTLRQALATLPAPVGKPGQASNCSNPTLLSGQILAAQFDRSCRLRIW